MSVQYSDPHQILSYDPMHNDDHGLGGSHLFPCVLRCLKAKGRSVLAELDERSSTITFLTSKIVRLIIYLKF